jgi:hypothetical protein
MAAPKGTAARTLEWTAANRNAGANRIRKWTSAAGFSTFEEWCGIFLGSALKAQGIEPPKGYPSAINWSNYGTKVNGVKNARPGDILVYGSNPVAMYLGNGRQIQGNDINGTVGVSGIGAKLGLGNITAVRRPPYKKSRPMTGYEKSLVSGGKSPAEARKIEEQESQGADGSLGAVIPSPKEAASSLADEVLGGILGDIAKSAEPLMLNVALVGGGAFLIYYGAAQLLGARRPMAPVAAAAGLAAKGAEA